MRRQFILGGIHTSGGISSFVLGSKLKFLKEKLKMWDTSFGHISAQKQTLLASLQELYGEDIRQLSAEKKGQRELLSTNLKKNPFGG